VIVCLYIYILYTLFFLMSTFSYLYILQQLGDFEFRFWGNTSGTLTTIHPSTAVEGDREKERV